MFKDKGSEMNHVSQHHHYPNQLQTPENVLNMYHICSTQQAHHAAVAQLMRKAQHGTLMKLLCNTKITTPHESVSGSQGAFRVPIPSRVILHAVLYRLPLIRHSSKAHDHLQ